MKVAAITYQRPQVMYSLDIGSPHINFTAHNRSVRKMAEEVSKVTGGCTIIGCTGMWAEVERADKDSYDNYSIGTESNVQLQVKAEIGKELKVEQRIVESIVEMAHKNPEFEINWVCGHKVTAEGKTVSFNFSVAENSEL